jgi:hypothetical protein
VVSDELKVLVSDVWFGNKIGSLEMNKIVALVMATIYVAFNENKAG